MTSLRYSASVIAFTVVRIKDFGQNIHNGTSPFGKCTQRKEENPKKRPQHDSPNLGCQAILPFRRVRALVLKNNRSRMEVKLFLERVGKIFTVLTNFFGIFSLSSQRHHFPYPAKALPEDKPCCSELTFVFVEKTRQNGGKAFAFPAPRKGAVYAFIHPLARLVNDIGHTFEKIVAQSMILVIYCNTVWRWLDIMIYDISHIPMLSCWRPSPFISEAG